MGSITSTAVATVRRALSRTRTADDAVSARFVLAYAGSDSLQVLSEAVGTATNLVSFGWAGDSRITAVAIDRRTGDLWVAGSANTGLTLYCVQLVSGRLLETITVPDDTGAAHFAALAIGPNALFVLDAAQRRIFTVAAKTQRLRVHATLPPNLEPTGLAYAGTALYVSHAAGLLRVDLTSLAQRRVSASNAVDISNLHSLAWHKGALLGIQRKNTAAIAVRVRLNARGTVATALEVIEPAGATAATLSGDVFYYLTDGTDDTGLTFRSVPAGK